MTDPVFITTVVTDGLVQILYPGGFNHHGIQPATTVTISLDAGSAMSPDIVLPPRFQPRPYDGVTLDQSIEVTTRPASVPPTTPPGPPSVAVPVAIVKTGGGDPSTFLIRIRNMSLVDETGPIEIYIRSH